MKPEEMIYLPQFCEHHHVDLAFVQSLGDYGLIGIVIVEEKPYLPLSELKNTEQMIRLHYELEINLEGLDAISHLLRRMDEMQREIINLRNRLTH